MKVASVHGVGSDRPVASCPCGANSPVARASAATFMSRPEHHVGAGLLALEPEPPGQRAGVSVETHSSVQPHTASKRCLTVAPGPKRPVKDE